MFYSFQSSQNEDSPLQRSANNKPAKGLHACVECKRRKIRCDGKQPCDRCQSRRSQSRCVYDHHRQRIVPSKRVLEELSQNLQDCRSILSRLFPGHDVSSLLPLSRQELCQLLDQPSSQSTEPIETLPSPALSMSKIQLLDVQQIPAGDAEWDEERRERDPLPAEADDVNGLSLTLDRQASYLGISSIKAAFGVMVKIQPQLRTSLASLQRSGSKRTLELPIPQTGHLEETAPIPWTWKGQLLIDNYFKGVHVFTPMLDEVAFRADYLGGQRCDAPWLSLLNMVFAMGAIMATKSSDLDHFKFYEKAMKHLSMGAFGSSHIETVQALALLGGYYLHYVNRPNMANAILGATIRMASALGLHREPVAGDNTNTALVEMRRRTWWSLFCLDTWTTTTMGRPSFGRCDPSIDIQPPQISIDQEERDSAQHAGIMPLLENIQFCKIATQIHDMLAATSQQTAESLQHLDGLLVGWYEQLPSILRNRESCAEPLHLARCVIKWRYLNLRMLLCRPILLAVASSDKDAPISEDDLAAIATCQELARQTIDDVASGWTKHQMSGWNAVWLLYQAAMIPLLSILWQPQSPSVADWQAQIEKTLEVLEAMEDWSLTARCSRDVVRRIYEASCQLSGQNEDVSAVETDKLPEFMEDDFYAWAEGLELDHMVDMLDQEWQWDIGPGQ
ncbi:fungal-specific transcription factor domain-containing protein [Fusarium solani]|uniref:Fungal-specific transcription factor domain-containing protein n=1 Tax=Fusarium solani TaxID=169388 RepID=A0A9P9G3M9_FUSSL|nr:fungal-specific transcription factor domain-containing protein [Fusarium solani]KAH7231515.1 fungal-specific transcription factor domain-containing protein [Fusarium solani]